VLAVATLVLIYFVAISDGGASADHVVIARPGAQLVGAGASSATRLMAIGTSGDFRVVLAASPASTTGVDRGAAVSLIAYRQTAGRWAQVAKRTVDRAGSFDWSSVRAGSAVRNMSVRGDTDNTAFEIRISAAFGWSGLYHFRLVDHRLVGGATLCGCEP
jgi:hypothetical protein